jgi:hypothetical protein
VILVGARCTGALLSRQLRRSVAPMSARGWSIAYALIEITRQSVLFVILLFLSSQLALAQFTQQGPKLVGTGASGKPGQGWSVALSADGNTAIVGDPGDNASIDSGIGAAWVYTRNNGVWTQQGSKLVGNDATVLLSQQGFSVSLSGDGNTAIVGENSAKLQLVEHRGGMGLHA